MIVDLQKLLNEAWLSDGATDDAAHDARRALCTRLVGLRVDIVAQQRVRDELFRSSTAMRG